MNCKICKNECCIYSKEYCFTHYTSISVNSNINNYIDIKRMLQYYFLSIKEIIALYTVHKQNIKKLEEENKLKEYSKELYSIYEFESSKIKILENLLNLSNMIDLINLKTLELDSSFLDFIYYTNNIDNSKSENIYSIIKDLYDISIKRKYIWSSIIIYTSNISYF